MEKRKKTPAEFRIYELPQGEDVLALTGERWVKIYGQENRKIHFHNLLEVGLCHYGAGDFVIEDRAYRFEGDMVSFVPSNVLHSVISDSEVIGSWEYLFVNPVKLLQEMFHGKKSREHELLELVNKGGFFIKKEENPALHTLVCRIFDEIKEKQMFYRESLKGLLYTMVLEGARQNAKNAGISDESRLSRQKEGVKLKAAVSFIEENYDRPFKISELAERCYMSETHFRRFFEERMDMAPLEFVNYVRIKKACELIDTTDLGMEEVAQKTGFTTSSTFNRNFRRIMGTSPYQWKKRPENRRSKLQDYKILATKGQ
jgi:AraC-like DNA-binding protein